MTAILLAITAVALLVTKALDVQSTWRHVGVQGECNPLARWLFRRLGLVWGLVLASGIYLGVLGTQLALVWQADQLPLTLGTLVAGLFIAWAQWDVARFNRTRCHSWFTRGVLTAYSRWNRGLWAYRGRCRDH
jgi:hypothetical protein